MKLYDVELKTSLTMHPLWEGRKSLIVRAKSKENALLLVEGAFEMPLDAIVDDVEKDIWVNEYTFEGEEEVLAHG